MSHWADETRDSAYVFSSAQELWSDEALDECIEDEADDGADDERHVVGHLGIDEYVDEQGHHRPFRKMCD